LRVASTVVGLMTILCARPADAETVRLVNGRLLTVEMCRFEGDRAVLLMRGGGQISVSRREVAEVAADEVPFARSSALEALAMSPTAAAPPMSAGALRSLVDRVAGRVGFDAKLAQAIVRAESNYQPLAVSRKGAMGLMQIMPEIVHRYALADPFDPEANLEAGMRHMQGLLKRFPLRKAVAAYNAGATAVVKYGDVPPYTETISYVQRVMAALR
jgi:soluble lytic murein transglycosylase-like protein